MEIQNGLTVSQGFAKGEALFIEDYNFNTLTKKVENTEEEILRLEKAIEKAIIELQKLYEKAEESADEEVANIFMIHQLMLQDEDFIDRVNELIIEEKICAEEAITKTGKEFSQDLENSGSDYIAERVADLSDITQLVVRILQGKNYPTLPSSKTKVILVANEITPSLSLIFEKSQLLGFISAKGSPTCHSAILARSLNIPAIVIKNAKFDKSINGKKCLIDGKNSRVIFSPDEEQIKSLELAKKEFDKKQTSLLKLKGVPAITKKGKRVELFCNASSLEDIDTALKNGAEGVGLFRSEFLYMGRNTLPSEDELAEIYSQAVKKLNGKRFVIRTLDIGADKQTECIPMKKETNPVLGVRGLRLSLAQPKIFITQLRSILRASSLGPVSIMFPMVTSLEEIKELKRYLEKAKEELKKENISYGKNIEVGIMVETPAAAVISDILAKEVDFFSIGTNDLTQYTLAVDRQNEDLENYCDPYHEAILRLIQLTIKNAHKEGIWCGLCGELGADLNISEKLLEADIDEISVSPVSLLPLKEKIRNI